MKETEKSALTVFLSGLPFFFFFENGIPAYEISVILLAAFWGTGIFFSITRKLFPPRLLKTAYFLWLGTMAQVIYSFFGIMPLWIISVILLTPGDVINSEARHIPWLSLFLRGVFMAIILVFLVLFREMLEKRLLVWTFGLPAGAFLLMSLAAGLWKNQPGGPVTTDSVTEGGPKS